MADHEAARNGHMKRPNLFAFAMSEPSCWIPFMNHTRKVSR